MKFVCLECKREFMYPTKKTEFVRPTHVLTGTVVDTSDFMEKHVCPYCGNLNIDEIHEETKIVSIKSVSIEEVDDKLKEGYEVYEIYAKTANLVKKQVKKEA